MRLSRWLGAAALPIALAAAPAAGAQPEIDASAPRLARGGGRLHHLRDRAPGLREPRGRGPPRLLHRGVLAAAGPEPDHRGKRVPGGAHRPTRLRERVLWARHRKGRLAYRPRPVPHRAGATADQGGFLLFQFPLPGGTVVLQRLGAPRARGAGVFLPALLPALRGGGDAPLQPGAGWAAGAADRSRGVPPGGFSAKHRICLRSTLRDQSRTGVHGALFPHRRRDELRRPARLRHHFAHGRDLPLSHVRDRHQLCGALRFRRGGDRLSLQLRPKRRLPPCPARARGLLPALGHRDAGRLGRPGARRRDRPLWLRLHRVHRNRRPGRSGSRALRRPGGVVLRDLRGGSGSARRAVSLPGDCPGDPRIARTAHHRAEPRLSQPRRGGLPAGVHPARGTDRGSRDPVRIPGVDRPGARLGE